MALPSLPIFWALALRIHASCIFSEPPFDAEIKHVILISAVNSPHNLAAVCGVVFLLPGLALAGISNGSELVKGKNCGIPDGTELVESSETIFKSPEVVTGKVFGSVKTTHDSGVVKS